MPPERLSSFLSHSGIASRRKCDDIIKSGRVKVNEIVIVEPFFRVNSTNDIITIDNHTIKCSNTLLYIALYKPTRYISDLLPEGKRLVARTLIPIDSYLFPIGRLDYNSEGLMIFSNDGDLANRIMHPRYGIEKEYIVKFKGVLSDNEIDKTTNGVSIDGSLYRVTLIKCLKTTFSNSWYQIILREGKNRMIRKIGDKINHPVLKLIRVRIGPVKLGSLKPGEYRSITDREKKDLLKLSQINVS